VASKLPAEKKSGLHAFVITITWVLFLFPRFEPTPYNLRPPPKIISALAAGNPFSQFFITFGGVWKDYLIQVT
jgi:hypothetical protein